MITQSSTMSVVSSPRLKSPAIHIITIIPIPQPSIIMTTLPCGVLTDALAGAPVPGVGMQTKTDAMAKLWPDA